jgi:hypothetical protein
MCCAWILETRSCRISSWSLILFFVGFVRVICHVGLICYTELCKKTCLYMRIYVMSLVFIFVCRSLSICICICTISLSTYIYIYISIHSVAILAHVMDFSHLEVLRAPVGLARPSKKRALTACGVSQKTAGAKFPITAIVGCRSSTSRGAPIELHGVIVVKAVSELRQDSIDHARQIALNVFESETIAECVLEVAWKDRFRMPCVLERDSFRFVSDVAELQGQSFDTVLDLEFVLSERPKSLRSFVTKPAAARVVLVPQVMAGSNSTLWSTVCELLVSRGVCEGLQISLREHRVASTAADLHSFPSLYSELVGRGRGGCPETRYSFSTAMACAHKCERVL